MPVTPGGRGLGVTFAPHDPRNWAYPHAVTGLVGRPMDIDLRSKMQPVGDQGQLGSCTGWAGTAALEAKLGDGQRSALYVYYYDRLEDGTAPGSDAGATMLGLCKALKDYGAPPEEYWYYNNSFIVEPTVNARAAATRIDAYYQIQGTGMALLQGIWGALAQGDTPAIALNIYDEFERMGRDGKAPMPLAGSRVLGGHAICACGWFNDNSAPGGLGWVMAQNSWGTGFGDGGYVYLPAAYFTSGIVREGWVIAVSAPVPPPPEPEPDVDEISQAASEMDAAITLLDAARYDLREIQPDTAWTYVGEASRIMGVARDRLPKVTPPPPPPPLTSLSGVYGTYPGHGAAMDLYGGLTDEQVQWGPHHGLPLVAPADGRIEVYQFGTPLSDAELVAAPYEWLSNWHRLAEGWTCRVPQHYGAQVMYVAVFWPASVLVIQGQRIGHLHYGHVRSDIKSGIVKRGEQFATVHDSGIRFEPGVPNARAAHTHCAAGAGTTLSPNGDLDGRLAVLAQGWSVTDIRSVPGPQDYLSGRYCAGRLLSDFGSGRHPIPAMPA